MEQMLFILPFIIPVKLLIFNAFGLYQGMWRYTGISDMWRLIQAKVFSSLIIIFAMLITVRFSGFPGRVFILDGFLTLLFTGGMRFGIRFLYQRHLLKNGHNGGTRGCPQNNKAAGPDHRCRGCRRKTLREVMDNPRLPFQVVGLIDDDPGKKGLSIHGISVLGNFEHTSVARPAIPGGRGFDCDASATGAQMRNIVETCELCKVRYRTLPGLGELIDGKVSVKSLRDVNFQDLLGSRRWS
jgi:FlaA1/EpsC-like NDP-sugar epimerase